MISRAEKAIYLSIIASLFIQFGKHFWPHFSLVSGIRVDYLSPTLYVSDILIATLLLIVIKNRGYLFLKKLLNPTTLILSGILLGGVIFSRSIPAGFFGLLKVFEFVFFGFYTASYVKTTMRKPFLYIVGICALIVSLIGILQYYLQHSLGGLFYFLGERSFNASTIDIATFSYHGSSILRPYATFPHPNVFAFFLLFSLIFLLVNHSLFKNKLFLFSTIPFITIAFLLTFSRVTLFTGAFLVIIYVFSQRGMSLKKAGVLCIPFIFLGTLFLFQRFSLHSLSRDWGYREELIQIYLEMFFKHPLFGTGLLNSFTNQIPYQKTVSPILLQPVHNIYLYSLVQTGILGFLMLSVFLIKTIRKSLSVFKSTKANDMLWARAVLYSLMSLLFVGCFDHFFLTLQQGQLILALIVGLSFAEKT